MAAPENYSPEQDVNLDNQPQEFPIAIDTSVKYKISPQSVISLSSGSEQDNNDSLEQSEKEESSDQKELSSCKEEISQNLNKKSALKNLAKLLKTMKHCEFTFGGIVEYLSPAPGICIKDLGMISLPIFEDQANKIIAAAKRAPFGRGKETLVDLNVRRTWQIDAADITLKNPLFIKQLEKLKIEIAQRIDCPKIPLELYLYKFLLYEPGAHFAKHRDTEKEDGMFGTLLIQLPSVYKGGQLKVYQKIGAKEFVHDFGQKEKMAPFACHYAFHFADAEHEVETITEGYRVVLTFSVCWPPNNMQKNINPDMDIQECVAAELAKINVNEGYFIYFLKHGYTKKSVSELGNGALKGVDRSRHALLIAANNILPPEKRFNFFIVSAERTCDYYAVDGDFYYAQQHDRYDDIEWELNEEDYRFEWFSVDGNEDKTLTKTFELESKLSNSKNVLHIDGKIEWHSEGSDYEGYLGNESLTKNVTYSNYLFVALPAMPSINFMCKYVNFETTLKIVLRQDGTQEDLRMLLEKCVQRKNKFKVKSSTAGECLEHIINKDFSDLLPTFFNAFDYIIFEYLTNSFDKDKDEANKMRYALVYLMESNMWSMVDKKVIQLLEESTSVGKEALELVKLAQKHTIDTKLRLQLIEIGSRKVTNQNLHDPQFVQFWWETILGETIDQLENFATIIEKKVPIDIFLSVKDKPSKPSLIRFLIKRMLNKVGEDQMKKPEFVDKIFNYYLTEAPNELFQFCISKLSLAPADWIVKKATCLEDSSALQNVLIDIALPKITVDHVRKQDFINDAFMLLLRTSKQSDDKMKRLDAFLNQCLTLLRAEKLDILLNVILDAEVKKLFCGRNDTVQKLVKIRYNWLVKIKRPIIEFPQIWSEQYPELYTFLRSDNRQITKHGYERSPSFDGIRHARNYAAQFSRYGVHRDIGQYVNMTPGGKGKNAHVNVTKSNLFYEKEKKLLEEYQIELKRLKSILVSDDIQYKGPAAKKIRLD